MRKGERRKKMDRKGQKILGKIIKFKCENKMKEGLERMKEKKKGRERRRLRKID